MKSIDELKEALVSFEHQRNIANSLLLIVLNEVNGLWDFCDGKTDCPYTEMEIRNFMKFLYEDLKTANFASINQPILEMEHVLGAALHKIEGTYKIKSIPTPPKPKLGPSPKATSDPLSKLAGGLSDEEKKALREMIKNL